ncbi:MAG TPA: prephenate dehydrogenase [Candidatus Avacidaminococcus intestinavium]|uniref:Prephenate dehydrogenase n=1 Tax=Candidatus Avacidaminococcus intestinavium TaxID=2840684 RepID=A0A9D1SKZ5_9FIRM|nr:prephenate dehydrogenase [Candidatus Avacidaminococcus intestinavium]
MPFDFSAFEQELQNKVFCIVGLGLIGGSYAKALKKLGVRKVMAVDCDAVTLRQAQQDGVIDEGYLTGGAYLALADIIIFAVYPSAINEFLKVNAWHLKPGTLVTDVAGVKAGWLAQSVALLPSGVDFVAGHPMAGREGSGYAQADADIFQNANYLVVPRKDNKATNILWLERFAKALGCKQVVTIEAERHDEIMAYTSNLPHLLAVAMINSESFRSESKNFIAGSFRDATRVADINATLWSELLLANSANLLTELTRLEQELQTWRRALLEQDRTTMVRMLEAAARKRKALTDDNSTS